MIGLTVKNIIIKKQLNFFFKVPGVLFCTIFVLLSQFIDEEFQTFNNNLIWFFGVLTPLSTILTSINKIKQIIFFCLRGLFYHGYLFHIPIFYNDNTKHWVICVNLESMSLKFQHVWGCIPCNRVLTQSQVIS